MDAPPIQYARTSDGADIAYWTMGDGPPLLQLTIQPVIPWRAWHSLEEVRACFRTHSPDGTPLIGADPTLPSFFWVAALGGYGMGASWELGRLAAAGLRGQNEPELIQIAPGRFCA